MRLLTNTMAVTGHWVRWPAAFAFACEIAQAQVPPGPMSDCSLYRYGPQLGVVAAATLDQAIARLASSKKLRAAVQGATGRVEVTREFQDEGLLKRDADCAEPIVRAFTDGEKLQLDLGALQPEVCLELLTNRSLAARGFALSALHVPTGQQLCGYSVNFIPKILALGRLTEAGRMISGSNTVTLAKAFGPARPLAQSQCEVKGKTALSPEYKRSLSQLPGGSACSFGSLSKGALACKSLHDSSVTCRGGQPDRECEAAIMEVQAALGEFKQKQARLSGMPAEERVDLLERLMATTEIDKLAAVPALARYAVLHEQQMDAVGKIFGGGRRNMVPGFEAAEQQKYARIGRDLLGTWVPKIAALRQPGETAEDVWARLVPAQRWSLVTSAYGAVNTGFALRPRRLDAVEGCRSDAKLNLAGAYTSPNVADPRADSLYICGNGTATANFLARSKDKQDYFGDLPLLLETLLHETLHAYQMELMFQVAESNTSSSQHSCTQARMLATGWSIECEPQTAACHEFYLSKPHELEARLFSETLTQGVLEAMRKPK